GPYCDLSVLSGGHAIRPGDGLAWALQVAGHLQEIALTCPIRFWRAVKHLDSSPSVNCSPARLAPKNSCLVLCDPNRAAVCHIAFWCHDLDHAATNSNIRLVVDGLY